MIDFAASADPSLRILLEVHPRVARVGTSENLGIDFQQGDWRRAVQIGYPSLEVAGLVELIDNNPMVCADRMSVPDAVSTLALVALGPLAWAGLILEPPTMISSVAADGEFHNAFLSTAGWHHGAILHVEERDLGGVFAATAMAEISTPSDWAEIDDLYDERFSKSFFVRRDDESVWDPDLVRGKAFAAYRLRHTAGEGRSLLTVQVLADGNGKCGRSQVVHAMNVMAGFEESLGVE